MIETVEIEIGKEYGVIIPPIERYCESIDKKAVVIGKSGWDLGEKGEKIEVAAGDYVCVQDSSGIKYDVYVENLRERDAQV